MTRSSAVGHVALLTTGCDGRNLIFNQLVEKVVDGMADRLSRAFAALSDPTRRDIVARLAVQDATVGELAAPYDVSVQAVSKHLTVLEKAGLVTRTRDGQRRQCHLEAEVFDLMTRWIERYRREAEARYQRLDAVLGDMQDMQDTQDTDDDLEQPEQGAAS